MKKLIILTLFCIINAGSLLAQTTGPQIYQTAGDFTFTPPPGVTQITVQLWGAGGGGNPYTGYGGGGGAYTRATFDLRGKTQVWVHVGMGGYSAQSGEISAVGIDSAGTKAYYAVASGGTGLYGNGGAASPNSSAVTFSAQGGNGSNEFYGYFGAGGGSAYTDGPHNAGIPVTATCQNGGVNPNGGNGGNGGGPVCTMTAGSAPGGGGGSSNSIGGAGATGRVIISWICPATSAIGDSHTVPYPQEKNPDYLTDVTGASPTGNGLIYTWEKSADNATWTTATNASDSVRYALPALTDSMFYRRKDNVCNVTHISNVVKIRVFRKKTYTGLTGRDPGKNGRITGYIKTKFGNPVEGDSVMAVKTIDLQGSPKTFTYYARTNNVGKFTLDSLFYGDKNNGDTDHVPFIIKPFKYQHRFGAPDSLITDLSAEEPLVDFISSTEEFKDTTVVSILGRAYQQCNNCLLPNGTTGVVYRGLDSVRIANGTFFTTTGFMDTAYGRYSITVSEINKSYTLIPSYKNHRFKPAESTVLVQKDVNGVDFQDTATHTVSGRMRAGCGEIIGTGTLLFTEIPQSPDRDPAFRIESTMNASGGFNVRLPAGKYKVRLSAFTKSGSGSDLQETNVLNFFSGDSVSAALNPDSLKVNIDTSDAVLNLTYQRPPQLVLGGLNTVCTTNTGVAYDVWNQLDKKPLDIRVYQGPPSNGCMLSYDSVRIFTTIQTDGIEEKFIIKVDSAGKAYDTLKAGVPNISGDYTKSLFIKYTDKYGSQTQLSKYVVVTGTRGRPGQTFETVSPQIPLLVLHDPPGDQSYSRWLQSKTSQTAIRMFTRQEASATIWAEAKLGVAFSTEVGLIASVSTDFAAWASINASASVAAKNSSENELIVETTTGTEIRTSSSNGIGSSGDLFYGGAMNIVYGISDVVSFSNCTVTSKEVPIFAPNKIMTTYLYTADDVAGSIANLKLLAQQKPDSASYFNNQARVWQQMLDNNEANKAIAPFVENRTFTGGGSSQEITKSASASSINSTEFSLEIDAGLAIELGLEVAGSGLKGGVMINAKMEMGSSTANTATTATEISYLLQDKDPGDKFTVDIKKDPVYGTPVFNTLAGLSSCPAEDKTISRDEMVLTVVGPSEQTGIPAASAASFILRCSNNSVDNTPKTYYLWLENDQSATVKIGGTTLGSAPYPVNNIPKGSYEDRQVDIRMNTGANPAFTYRDLKFILSDACNPTSSLLKDINVSRTQLLSVSFISPCSGISLAQPEANWVNKKADNNVLKIVYDGYTPAGLSSVVLEYRITGASSWTAAASTLKTAADLTGSTSYVINWNVATLTDSKYDLRLKLVCPSGIVYSKTSSGIIDRKSPSLSGNPEPADDNFTAGDIIAFNYDEAIDLTDLNYNKVEVYKMSSNSLIPSTVSGYGNRLVIAPSVNLLNYTGDSINVVVSNISDIYGNKKTTQDITKFTIGAPPVASASRAVKVYIAAPSMYENAGGNMEVHFKLDSAARRTTRINYSIGGNALFNNDYTIAFDSLNKIVNGQSVKINDSYNGTQGFIYIDSSKKEAVLKLDPVGDSLYESDETIVINLMSGGDYALKDSFTATGTIRNDELQPPSIKYSGPLAFCPGGSVILTAATPNVITRYANSVIAVSDQYSANEWGALHATGAPDVYPQYGDIQYAWSPASPDNAREYLVLAYPTAAPVNFIDIYETYNPGAIDTVYVKNAATGSFNTVYTATAGPAGDSARLLHITFPVTGYDVSAVRIALKSSAVPGYNEIDAVGIGQDTTYTSYLWSTGAVTKSITVNSAGNYYVTATNAAGQHAKAQTITVRRSATTATFITANSNCGPAPTGAIQVNATGGIAPYYYKLDSLSADRFQSSPVLKPLKAGSYRISIKDSIECVITSSPVVITQPVNITGTFTKTDATCIGKADGTITINATGGKAPYGYKIDFGGNFNDSKTITGLKAGTYIIYVKDVNGCISAVGPVTVGQTNVNCLSANAAIAVQNELRTSPLSLVLTPNPASDLFVLRVFSNSNQPMQLRVLDINGRILYTAKGQPDQAFRFGESFITGTYLVEVRQGEVIKTIKAVKVR